MNRNDQEEMLIPYDPLLSLDSRWVLTGDTVVSEKAGPVIGVARFPSHVTEMPQLLGSSRLMPLPGDRESEARVLMLGLDLMDCRLSPSKSFDVLSRDFNQSQLVLTLAVLSLGLFAARSMVSCDV